MEPSFFILDSIFMQCLIEILGVIIVLVTSGLFAYLLLGIGKFVSVKVDERKQLIEKGYLGRCKDCKYFFECKGDSEDVI